MTEKPDRLQAMTPMDRQVGSRRKHGFELEPDFWRVDKLLPTSLRMMSYLGKGTHGIVFQAHDLLTNEMVAVKSPRKQCYASHIRREIHALKKLSHPHIVQHYGFVLTADMKMLHVMELMEGGDLCQLISSQRGLADRAACLVFAEICLATQFLHQQGLVHSDIKPENVLMTAQGTAKLCDMEMLCAHGSQVDFVRGTRSYAAPELVANEGRLSGNTTQDVFSLGVMLFVMLRARFPWHAAAADDSNYKAFAANQHRSDPQWKAIVTPLRRLMQHCLRANPAERCTARVAGALALKFVRNEQQA